MISDYLFIYQKVFLMLIYFRKEKTWTRCKIRGPHFVTTFEYLNESSSFANDSYLYNKSSYNFNEKNSLSFKTRENKKEKITEFYNLIYEYKNDCLIAGIKYKKTYYEDRDLKPTEDLLFTITLFPLTTYEQKIDR